MKSIDSLRTRPIVDIWNLITSSNNGVENELGIEEKRK